MDDIFEIERFGRDLTAEARAGKLPAMIGREEILARIMEVLGRSTKNNPILVGESGVGKTAIVEGLAQVIVGDKCPSWLKSKRLISIEMAALIAGTRARGDFEARLKQLADYLSVEGGRTIVFFDEIHQLVNLGRSEGSVDAANFFKPMLARGEIHNIGATTFDEYRLIEKDAALARRYIVVRVDEPNERETLAILRGLRERLESHHGVRIHEEALAAALELTNRYIPDRRQPDKAIDVLDEACASLKASGELPPAKIREWETSINQLRVQEKALRREGGDALIRVRAELKKTERELDRETREWRTAVENREKYASLLKLKDECINKIDTAESNLNLKAVVDLKIKELLPITSELSTLEVVAKQHALTAPLIAEVVARMTKIRTAGLAADAYARLRALDHKLRLKWPNQTAAIESIRSGLTRAFAGISSPYRPLLTAFIVADRDELIMDLARTMAFELCDGAIIASDMREYSEKSSITKLIGAPPAYTGFESSTHVLEKVRQRPFSVIVFRNMDQAHEEVARLVLSIINDGTLSDGMGRPITFRHAIVLISGGAEDRWNCDCAVKISTQVTEDNRAVLDYWLRELRLRIQPRAILDMSPEALDFLVEVSAKEPAELKQHFRERVENPIAQLMLEQAASSRIVISLNPDHSGLSVETS